MKEADLIKDMLSYVISLQVFYNESVINITNPEARQLFTQLRDDETRNIIKLQQKSERVETKSHVISRLLPSKSRF